jgi:hypothetical protein
MPPRPPNAAPAPRHIDSTSTTDEIRSTHECMGVGERGILVALAAEILAVDAATRYPQRWVMGAGTALDDKPIPFVPVADPQARPFVPVVADEPVGERIGVSGHRGAPHDCPHPQCSAARR